MADFLHRPAWPDYGGHVPEPGSLVERAPLERSQAPSAAGVKESGFGFNAPFEIPLSVTLSALRAYGLGRAGARPYRGTHEFRRIYAQCAMMIACLLC